ncbi:MAG: hypothetical protein MUC83_10580 [Pirellula sp.]|jgi:uncharacterized protein (UPF0147 family)|nr:hypothetical protein [Pirellula sp.]
MINLATLHGHQNRRKIAAGLGLSVLAAILAATFLIRQLTACPLCEAVGSTISDDLQSPAIGVIVKVTDCKTRDDGAGFDLMVDFVDSVGEQKTTPKFDGIFSFSEVAQGKKILLIGTPDVAATSTTNLEEITWLWNTPLELSDTSADYVQNLPLSDRSDSERLDYFYKHLYSTEQQISDDAYSECARISLDTIRKDAFRQTFDKQKLIDALRNPDFPAKYKSFLWMVLAELGEPNDAPIFGELAMPLITEELKNPEIETIQSSTLANYPWLAASMACYARLGGEPALQALEEKVLSNRQCPVGLKSAAISAIRVLGSDLDPSQMTRSARALAHVLEDPLAADLVIPDLARWEYWEAIPELSKLFHTPESEQGLARYLIINYMRHCPLPQAVTELEKMKAHDPRSYRRAVTMVPNVDIK